MNLKGAFLLAVTVCMVWGCGPSKRELAEQELRAEQALAERDFKTHIAEIRLAAGTWLGAQAQKTTYAAASAAVQARTDMNQGCHAAMISWEASQTLLPASYSNNLVRIARMAGLLNQDSYTEQNAGFLQVQNICDGILREP